MGDSPVFENVPAETPLSPEEAVIRRHRKEKKELQGHILAMKKSAGKADKKKKKELTEEIHRLETELEARHKQELDTFLPKRVPISTTIHEAEETSAEATAADNNLSTSNPENNAEEFYTPCAGTPKLSRAQKRREKKSAQEKERDQRIEDETKTLSENSLALKEENELAIVLGALSLQVCEIPADGNCLYAAVAHQLKQFGEAFNAQDLRIKTSAYLKDHRDEFVNYLEDESARESDEGFQKYCNDIKNTSVWGGQVEIQILAKILSKTIHVIQADGPELVFGEGKPELNLTFHKHKLSLGAHYNSAIPTSTN